MLRISNLPGFSHPTLSLLLVATKKSKSIKPKYFLGKREQKNLVQSWALDFSLNISGFSLLHPVLNHWDIVIIFLVEEIVSIKRREMYLDQKHVVKFANLFHVWFHHFEESELKTGANPKGFPLE